MLLNLRRALRALFVVLSTLLASLVGFVSAEPVDNRPVLYLTFDDGPSADGVTDELLQVLAMHDAKATFFVTGQRTRKSPEKISAILYAGHSIGNHTDNHARLTEVSRDEVFYELNAANAAILNAGGPPLTCFRPPFGLTDHRVNTVAYELGLIPVKWTIDTRDWDLRTDAEELRGKLDTSVDGSIVLLHDGPVKRGRMLRVFKEWMADNSGRYQFKGLPQCDTYGDLTFVSIVEESPREQTIPELLEKLRGYSFTLDQVVGQSSEQLTAKLNAEIARQ